ncbi:methyltransferase family protein [Neolewinella xylanilytica]|uniref:Methyltransferase family protein n=1 Tax=Neolewinella xylanilytica TaxID=1514080 RepID=A0A2S6I8S0_9BACT|nr:class I SAM-dependent methyltransferase [Neolewinella xylanilytica]PPK87883.1 methyltransferase family protein [Neolewinella xylanilytica]
MKKEPYHPEPYWSTVAQRIGSRSGKNVIAGDDEPYYRYKRERFLEMLSTVDFNGKSVLEIGHGPGGNLKFIHDNFTPSSLAGVDISADMVRLAKSILPASVELTKINGTKLPFADRSVDIVFTATVLQHNTDEKMLIPLIKEISRISKSSVFIFERIDDPIAGDELCLGRPVSYYEAFFNDGGFQLVDVEYINIHASYLMAGAIRKGLNRKTREEGEPLNGFSLELQEILLPLSKKIDKILTKPRDLAKLAFRRS